MRVLCGVGGAEDSVAALDRAVSRAVAAGDELTVAVVENPDSPRAAETVVGLARERLAAAGLEPDLRRLSGRAGPALVELAERGGYDELVVGGGERTPMGKLTVGPIAEFVLLNGDVTVTLVR